MLARRPPRPPPAPRRLIEAVEALGRDIFRLEGEYWTITFQGVLCRLRDAKGLHYLAHLLLRPGERVHCRDLAFVAGRPKSGAAVSAERARLAVTKRIKAAVSKIEQHHAALGLHLIASIKTGYQCAYLPDPHDPISWSL